VLFRSGTKGKSTTVMLAGKILEETGVKVAWLTSATIKVDEKEDLNPYHMTMPGRFAVQKFLRQAVDAGCKYALLEVTSEGVKQHRHRFINFDTAVFTNLKPEHIEAHGSFENYRFCKGKLFSATKKNHIINLDDKNVEYFLQFSAANKWGYTIGSPKSKNQTLDPKFKTVYIEDTNAQSNNIKFSIKTKEFNLKLLGEFNIYNAAAAICIASIYGVSLEKCKQALEGVSIIPGRMETIASKPFKVIVDLAHTPESFEEVFRFIKKQAHNRIIAVFGAAGGGRDKWKRPVLGKIAASYADTLILTNEDPYSEDPNEILLEIESGVMGAGFEKANLYKILDREEAIKKSFDMAQDDDIILLLGKGTEQLMVFSDKKIPWDDRKIARRLLSKR
ncbi:MAG: UDP-N-acetylmuramyl-tripeptide synthetase, partial [Candidatus Staskawiczbacteria bacterium]